MEVNSVLFFRALKNLCAQYSEQAKCIDLKEVKACLRLKEDKPKPKNKPFNGF